MFYALTPTVFSTSKFVFSSKALQKGISSHTLGSNFASKTNYCNFLNKGTLVPKTANSRIFTPSPFFQSRQFQRYFGREFQKHSKKFKQDQHFFSNHLIKYCKRYRLPKYGAKIAGGWWRSLGQREKIVVGALFVFIGLPIIWWFIKFLFRVAMFVGVIAGGWYLYRRFFRSSSHQVSQHVQESLQSVAEKTGMKNTPMYGLFQGWAHASGLSHTFSTMGKHMAQSASRNMAIKNQTLEIMSQNSQVKNLLGSQLTMGMNENIKETNVNGKINLDMKFNVSGMGGDAEVFVKAVIEGEDIDYNDIYAVLPNGKKIELEQKSTIDAPYKEN